MTKEQIARKLHECNRLTTKEVLGVDIGSWEYNSASRQLWLKIVLDERLYEELSTTHSSKELYDFFCRAMGYTYLYIEHYYQHFFDQIKWFREYVHPSENSLTGKTFILLVSKRRFEFICNGILTGDIRFLDGRKEILTIQMKDLREISEEE